MTCRCSNYHDYQTLKTLDQTCCCGKTAVGEYGTKFDVQVELICSKSKRQVQFILISFTLLSSNREQVLVIPLTTLSRVWSDIPGGHGLDEWLCKLVS